MTPATSSRLLEERRRRSGSGVGDPDDRSDYVRRLGRRLRAVRGQLRLSLEEVEESSGGEFKTSALGAYERGERTISVSRLHRLAAIYGVSVRQLLPPRQPGEPFPTVGLVPDEAPSVTFDLRAVEQLRIDSASTLRSFLDAIQAKRQDFNGRVLTVREADLMAIACMMGVEDATQAVDQLRLTLVHR